MEYLSKIVLPISLTNIILLKYLFILGKILFLGYSGVLLISTFYTLTKRKNSNFNFAKEYSDLVAIKNYIPYALGVLPLFSIVLIAFILLNGVQYQAGAFLFLSLFLYLTGIVLFNAYNFNLQKGGSETTWGNLSFIIQLVSIILFLAITSSMTLRENWHKDKNLIEYILNLNFIIDLALFFLYSISFTNLSFIFKMKLQNKLSINEIKPLNKIVLITLLMFFIVFNINYFAINNVGYSYFSFIIGFLANIFIIAQLILLYVDSDKFNFKFSVWSFSNAILVFVLVNFSGYSFLAYASEIQVKKIASVYDKKELEYKLAHSKVEINGQEIYQAKCVACHKFDQRLVGPPHKEVMKKYAGKMDAMVQFILKPVKVDPAYPDMPQQGLTPAEAKAVVEYMYKEYGEKIK